MACKRSDSTFIAASVAIMFFGTSASAADLSISAHTAASVMSTHAIAGKEDRILAERMTGKGHHKQMARAGKLQRPDKVRKPRIITYNLYDDPVFKLAGAVSGKRPGASAADTGTLGTGVGFAQPSAPNALPAVASMKAGERDSEGIAFDCRGKSASTGPWRPNVTACYKYRLDKSWKTQTYLSKGVFDGNSDWGGGLVVTYAH